jgi:hypothetical protein
MFIRAKKIKNNHYAYLVKNSWKKGLGARQKVSRYLGRIIFLERVDDRRFIGSLKYPDLYLRKTRPYDMLIDFLKFKLSNYGFTQDQKKDMLMNNDEIDVDLRTCRVRYEGKPIILGINNDFLCDSTLRGLLRFKTDSDFDGAGIELAKAFMSTGFSVEEEFFVHLFKKIFNPEGQTYIF